MKKRKKTVLSDSELKKLDPTSSLQKHFMCVCGLKWDRKQSLVKHTKKCTGEKHTLVCRWCNLKFKNKGNLVMHSYYMHNDKSLSKLPESCKKIPFKCEACDAKFSEFYRLKYHIRKMHFNLNALFTTPHFEDKKINEMWFEKILNSDMLMRIVKTGVNTLAMKPVKWNPSIKVTEVKTSVDLSSLYPTGRRTIEEECKICHRVYKKIDLKKHIDEKHLQHFRVRCNNCNRFFKRWYIYLQHMCTRVNHQDFRIESYGSVECVEID